MLVGALCTFLAKTFHPKVAIPLTFAPFFSLALTWLFLGRGIGRMRTAMSGIIDVGVLAFSANEIVDASISTTHTCHAHRFRDQRNQVQT